VRPTDSAGCAGHSHTPEARRQTIKRSPFGVSRSGFVLLGETDLRADLGRHRVSQRGTRPERSFSLFAGKTASYGPFWRRFRTSPAPPAATSTSARPPRTSSGSGSDDGLDGLRSSASRERPPFVRLPGRFVARNGTVVESEAPPPPPLPPPDDPPPVGVPAVVCGGTSESSDGLTCLRRSASRAAWRARSMSSFALE